MFLKRMELSGFKSFADRTVIQFDAPLTGVVGPNGCGKSNITDAIRWVLGEQSAKSLRSGSSMSDIIFSGSQTRKPVNTAKVTLVFDNSAKIFDSPYEEIEITRQISRSSSEISNFINKTPCRLKDIQDLVMDTGLGRDSLSIITQGNISSFADAKPEERRTLFEEAAGVAKYKKRKKISLAKLESVQSNLERLQDLADSYKEQVDTLEKQAEKAVRYIALRDELTEIEVSLLAARIGAGKKEEEECAQQLASMQAEQLLKSRQLEQSEEEAAGLQKEIFACDLAVSQAQSELSALMQESVSLQKQKAVLDERRKMDLDGDDAAKKKQSLLALFEEARFEYEDRRKRLAQSELQLQKLMHNENKARAIIENARGRKERCLRNLSSLSSELAGIESRLHHPSAKQRVIEAVLANRQLRGIHNTVSNLITSDERFAMAMNSALAGASDQIIVSNEKDAREAIAWLKQRKIGKATFLPLTVCKPRTLQPWQQQKAQESQGILGTADQFARCEPIYDTLKSRLLGNILIAENLECANAAARKLNQTLKIVTLEGDVVHAGGAMSGGFQGRGSGNAALAAQKAQVQASIEQTREELAEIETQISRLEHEFEQLSARRIQSQIDREKLASFLQVKKEKYESLQGQIAQLDISSREKSGSDLVEKLSLLHQQQDELNSKLQLSLQTKQQLASRQQDLQNAQRLLRRELSSLASSIQQYELRKARCETRLEQDLLRLGSDYSLTYEAAQRQAKPVDLDQADAIVRNLRKKLSAMGNVNLEAPEQLAEVSEKYEFLTGQMQELRDASAQIVQAVDEMDETMCAKFSSMFEKINASLDEVFKAMFGGGKAKLVLCDPDDLLNTGIDVDVQPPGKAVKNMQTFSGGEKALIAISVLFAILKARTVPLCIFDEVEAALDQANVERFARYLSNFKGQSQFITVTHRPGTMEQCDTLYGITMQQDGVSQVLRVLLQDARDMSRQV